MGLTEKIRLLLKAVKAFIQPQAPAENLQNCIYVIAGNERQSYDMLYLSVVLASNGLKNLPVDDFLVYKEEGGAARIYFGRMPAGEKSFAKRKTALIEKEKGVELVSGLARKISNEFLESSYGETCAVKNPARTIYIMPESKAKHFAYVLENKYGLPCKLLR